MMLAMRPKKLRTFALAVLSFAAGSLLTARLMKTDHVRADSNRVFELRVYHANPGRLGALSARFRDETIKIFNKHGLSSVAYWTPADSPASDNTLIYILAHPSREAAKANWAAFQNDPDWKEVVKKTEADGKLVDHVDSTYMNPTDYSPMK
jgi:hypothetical protein